jgi:hypothetical protein
MSFYLEDNKWYTQFKQREKINDKIYSKPIWRNMKIQRNMMKGKYFYGCSVPINIAGDNLNIFIRTF